MTGTLLLARKEPRRPLLLRKMGKNAIYRAEKRPQKPPAVTIHGEDFCQNEFTGKERDEETGLYYYGARYLDPKTGRWLSGDPALGDYLPSAPVDEEARKRNGSLPGQGGVYNYVNLHVYHYSGNNPVRYTDPDGAKIVYFSPLYNMSNYGDKLGNSPNETIAKAGCYITTFANMFASAITALAVNMNRGLADARKFTSPIEINDTKTLFEEGTGNLNGRESSMNALFGKGNWDYWTKDVQGSEGLLAKLKEYGDSGKNYMIAGIFDLSGATEGVDNHMVGITGLPNKDGVFESISGTSNGDNARLSDSVKAKEYNIKNLKEIRVIFIDN